LIVREGVKNNKCSSRKAIENSILIIYDYKTSNSTQEYGELDENLSKKNRTYLKIMNPYKLSTKLLTLLVGFLF